MKPLSKWWLLLLLVSLLLLFSACTPTPNCVVNYTVTKEEDTNDGVCSNLDCSLREAVLNANSCPGPHTITLPAGSYSLTILGIDEDAGETGDLDITKDLTIIGIGAPSINGNIDRSFHIHSPAMVTMDGIWLANGTAILGGGLINEGELYLSSFTCNYNSVEIPPGGMGDARGGCIFNTGGLTILGGQFLANTAGYGGAIYNYENASLIIENSDFTGNEADHLGGAIWNGLNADLDITGTSFRLNESDLHGGGIWTHGVLEGVDLYFEDNQAAGNGGGVFAWTDSFSTFTNTWFTLNTADLGGGLYNDNGMVHFYESGLTANTATGGAGGGVYNLGPAPPAGLLMKNVTVSNNTATGGLGGGGIYNNSNFDLRFITVADNNPEGIRIDGGTEIKIRSSALANNGGGNCAGTPPDSLDYNIENDGSCAFSGPHDLPTTDPLLEPLAAHGGMAPSHALGVGSPAIDTGVPDLCIAYDQNGTTRPQGAWCDRGAHEMLGPKGIIRGWTYMDTNRNDNKDPAEGGVTNVILDLKEGPCPGGIIVETVHSASPSGFYEIPDIEPGDYCIDTSPIQQTLYPEYIDLTLGQGDVLEDVNFRYLLSPLGDSSISGKVWHDECAVPFGTPPTTPPGCISYIGGGFGADGIYDPAEPGIPGIMVRLYSGGCPVGDIAISGGAYTDINGNFIIPGLTAHTWCVVVDALAGPNAPILIPGSWTYPARNVSPAEYEVVLGASEDAIDINFGWDYQFLPEPTSILGTFNSDGFCREGPRIDHFPVTAFVKGTEVEILARTEPHLPLWWYIKELKLKILCWVSATLIDTDLDPNQVETREAPPTPRPSPTPTPIPCTKDLPKDQCLAAGGTWSTGTTTAPYCICP